MKYDRWMQAHPEPEPESKLAVGATAFAILVAIASLVWLADAFFGEYKT